MKTILLLIFLLFFCLRENNYSQELTLLGYIDVLPDEFVTDVWGYVDPANNKEYAIIGAFNGIEIIDVSIPSSPRRAASLDVPGFDMKVWKNYLYTVTGGGGINQGKIVDITDPENPAVVDSFNSAHNIFISETGYLFAEIPGLTVYNLNVDPLNPDFIWSDGTDGGHDASVIGNILYDFHGASGTNIYELTYGTSLGIKHLGIISSPLINYHHSGWITENERYLFICDEGAIHPGADITVWDISDPANPEMIEEFADPSAIVHNLYIIGNYAYVSYYTSGFRVFDVSDPENISVAAHYDTSPDSGEGFSGAFGVYPFFSSGKILVSDQTGLYIFSFNPATVDNKNNLPQVIQGYELLQNYPNPFNPKTTISFNLPSASYVELKIYNSIGSEIKTLVDGYFNSGKQSVYWDGKDDWGKDVSSGIYLYKLNAGDIVLTKKMALMK